MTTPIKTRRVFVTGATGYLGARLIPLLLERGHRVTALARPESVRKVPTGCQIVVGNPLESGTFVEQVRGADTFVQLVGVPKPAPWKGPQFRAIDGPSAMAAIRAAREAGVRHMVYGRGALPARVMRDYVAVRSECEPAIAGAGLVATILRPWYILGPGHWWPLALQPVYRLMEQFPGTRAAALRLGLVTIHEMLMTMLWAIEQPPSGSRVIEVPEIRRLGRSDA